MSFILFVAPVRTETPSGYGVDKAVHFFIFAALGYYGFLAYRENRSTVFVVLVFYALLVEHLQNRYFGRTLDWYDSVAGIAGLATIYLHRK